MMNRGGMHELVMEKMGMKRREALINKALNPPREGPEKLGAGKEKGACEPGQYKHLEEFNDRNCVYEEEGQWFICPTKFTGEGESEKCELGKPEKLLLTRAVNAGADKAPALDQGKDRL